MRTRALGLVLAATLVGVVLAVVAPVARAADHVIQISVDGLSGTLLQALLANDATGQYPNFARFASEGAVTYNARTDYAYTNTLPNHTSMLTGRPVSQPTGLPNTVHHGWTSNSDPDPDETLHNSGNPNLAYVAGAFDVAHDHGLSTALYASKTKFVIYEQSYDSGDGAPDTTGANDGADKIDRYVNASAASIQASFNAQMTANRFRYVFMHFSTPDDVGHASGWGTPAWNTAVRDVDVWLGQIFALIAADPLLAGKTLVILSSDHGGTGTGHGSATDVANYTIPFLVWGNGVEPGADLYALNPGSRADPGGTRPSYTATPQPIRNGDGANLALDALGLPPVPGSLINVGQDLAVGSAAPPVPILPTED